MTKKKAPARARKNHPLGEAALFHLLRARYSNHEYALFQHVGNATGSAKSRTADALAMGTWPSRGLKLTGFEMKSYRYDWLRELKAPSKAEGVCRFCDFWYLVTADETVALVEELPPTWGLLYAQNDKLIEARRAEQRVEVEPMTRSFMAAILRAASQQQQRASRADVFQIQERERRRIQEAHVAEIERLQKSHEDDLNQVHRVLDQFNEGLGLREAGLSMNRWTTRAREIGQAARFLLNGGFDGLDRQLEGSLFQLRGLVTAVEAVVAECRRAKTAQDTAENDA